MKLLAVVLTSSILVACGGGGSDAPTPSPSGVSPPAGSPAGASQAIEALVKYEGVWREGCRDHMQLTKTFTATGGTTFSVLTIEEYFDNADCTGALLATGGFGQPEEAVQYSEPLANASVTLLTGETIVSTVDPATSVMAVASFPFTGSHVTSTSALGTTFARIEYADGSDVIVQRQALIGQTAVGALLIPNDELLALVPIGGSTTSFQVNHRYVR